MSSKFLSHISNMMSDNDNKRLATQKYDYSHLNKVLDIDTVGNSKREDLIDIYYPKQYSGKLPLIINIHGGGLIYGYKEINVNFNCEVAQRGYVVASINYPLIPHCNHLQQIQSIARTLQYISGILDDYPVDKDNIFISGDSAGGLLAIEFVMLSTDKQLQQLYEVQFDMQFNACCLISPMTHTKRDVGDLLLLVLNRHVMGKTKVDEQLQSYIDNISKFITKDNFLPAIIFTSAEDFLRKECRNLYAHLKDNDIECQLIDINKAKGQPYPHVYPVIFPKLQQSQYAIDQIKLFFDSYIGKKPSH